MNKIINGNSIEELKKIKENSVDLIFADPPYWMRVEGVLNRVEGTAYKGCDDIWDQFDSLEEYKNFTKEWLSACYRVLKSNGSIWVIGSMQCIYTIGAAMQDIGYWFINDIVWNKLNPTPNFLGTRLNNSHETLIWATKSKKSKYTFNYKTAKELNRDNISNDNFENGIRKQMGSVWNFAVCSGNERLKDSDGNKLHTTQKPGHLLYRLIAISSKKGDLVLDPFGGTMTTGAMAKLLGRRYIMIEKDSTYCKYGKKRLDKIEYCDNDIANATFDIKPLRVSIKEMIENGFFETNEKFCLKNGKPIATLQKNGRLLYESMIMDIHSCVALAKGVKAKKLNGFEYWQVIREGKLVSINDIREQYRAIKSQKDLNK